MKKVPTILIAVVMGQSSAAFAADKTTSAPHLAVTAEQAKPHATEKAKTPNKAPTKHIKKKEPSQKAQATHKKKHKRSHIR
uniref:hypothetical protein n=1 Tax=Yersinia frederiksenii TaxID=29484 RepID=UPI001F4C23D5|nr:hypothetical protein [Yersinia frederiksenii]ULG19803.1 Acid shock protein [Yersinia frederiksenii]